ncbi:ABC transporter ATP-binding protein [Caballeronia zhejiangensis]|uniref:Iron ABC transporter ATP-binding protein n=1 Tax=Caballeronia zhejiangensis TaxID=871203 RepID=A0A656Q7W6_9BURK|nr:ATP-binding cassette domain-containing protein [Caballeronia zhejiangensis]AET95408.1 ABC transporter-related protein [Burkholderia sp. YI23]KAK42480.1 iron ABC transporter ATP-binding protein [Caballeronia jiangsuensis]KDR24702.1 iron ABC transporter ATP-binding protein [Caballeronia zhejiangensis]BBQ03171.1 ABC transporter ATP-binding protein [Burkholderia sp. SFA1]
MTTAITVRGLRTVFPGPVQDTVIHDGLDLTVARGEIVSLVGGSGTGKSVLLRQMLGLERPAAGTVTVLGEPAERLGRTGAAQRVGMLFQQGALFSAFSVLDNIALPLRELRTLPERLVREAAMVKLQMVGLGPEHAHKLPSDLSGGMVKRVALARALALDPPLLFLDEPTAGLDPDSSDGFCQLLAALHRELGLTVVMVTHDLDTLFALSTQVAVLAEKRVIVHDTPEAVVRVDHPFIETFFRGERGRRAQAPLPPPTPSPPSERTRHGE